jgi:hypothetical protein
VYSLPQVVHRAGLLACEGVCDGKEEAGSEVLSPYEMFYSRPSRGLPALMAALGAAGEAIRGQVQQGLGGPQHASKCASD